MGSFDKDKLNSYLKAAEVTKNSGLTKTTVDDNKTSDKDVIHYPDLSKLKKENGVNGENVKKQAGFDKTSSKDSIYRRVAKFLLIIGIDEAAKILPHLTDEQVEKIVPEIASIRSVDPDEATVILAEFQHLVEKSREGGGVSTAKSILEKAFGAERAEEMLSKVVPFPDGKPFEYLQDMDDERIYYLIEEESASIQALILSYLEPKTAANIINKMKPDAKTEVIRRLGRMTAISPEVIRRVDQGMKEKVQNVNTSQADKIDGRGALADILKKMSPDHEKGILSMLSETDPELGLDLRQRLFTIDDVINCEDKAIQKKLQTMNEVEIAYLIAGKKDDFRDKILKNISSARRAEVLEEEQIHHPMARKDCEAITSEFFSYLRREWEQGKIIILGRDEDQYVL